jgi:hypothetical protein
VFTGPTLGKLLNRILTDWGSMVPVMTHARLCRRRGGKTAKGAEVAELQCAKGWGLRAAMSIARLWRD